MLAHPIPQPHADLAGLVAVGMVVLIMLRAIQPVVLDRQTPVAVVERKALVRKQIHQQHLVLVVLALLF